MYQEIAWRIVLLFSLLDFSYIHISQETRYFPWPNLIGVLLLVLSLFLFRKTVRPPWESLSERIRFPHHLASILWVVGNPLSLSSGIGIIFAAICVVPTYIYRMDVEDDALNESLGKPYSEYMERTERLIPWIY